MYYLVQDNSMKGDRIKQGDVLVVEKNRSAIKPNDIVLVRVSSKTMVRRVLIIEGNFVLVPSNRGFEEVVCDRIEVIGVIKKCLVF